MSAGSDQNTAVHMNGSKHHPRENGGKYSSQNGVEKANIRDDAMNAFLLVVLYMVQGIPLGLSMGSMPFLMRSTMSYTKIGIFTLAAYPYSFKLLWSPLVDTLYFRTLRRKSWIIPLQTLAAAIMILYGGWVESRLYAADAVGVTALFFILVLLAATQDIAVDGWALTLLSKKNVGYAATCQTVGMNIGYFSSFTIFLALSDPEFCSAYLGTAAGVPLVTLSGYMKFWGYVYLAVTAGIALFKKEGNSVSESEKNQSLKDAYTQLWKVVNLKTVRLVAVLLMVARLGMLAAESAAPLKLLEKGVSKEALAGLVLVEFPIELVSAVIAGRWAASSHPLRPYFTGYLLRLVLAGATTTIVYFFPKDAHSLTEAPWAFGMLAFVGVITSFASTLMFTALGDFFNRVSDPEMGGAYLTLLNTLANVGVVVPKLAVFAAMDFLTVRKCAAGDGGKEAWLNAACGPASASGAADGACIDAGGKCVVVRDGFYVLVAGSFVVGLAVAVWMKKALRTLEAAPASEWRVTAKKKEDGKEL